jgi:YfiH family protein
MKTTGWIKPNWPAPGYVHAVSTTRSVDAATPEGKAFIQAELALTNRPLWLKQTHSKRVALSNEFNNDADACYSNENNQACVVLTGDCLPVLICSTSQREVAAVHAGWRGLAKGIISAAVKQFNSPVEDLLIWLGPAIGPQQFEVGPEVKEQFLQVNPNNEAAFVASETDRYMADIYQLAKTELAQLGIEKVYGGNRCTKTEADYFFSNRNQDKGRMASLIWLA